MMGRLHYKILLCCLLFIGMPQSSFAFYQWQGGQSSIELRGQLRGFTTSLNNPDNPLFYEKKNISELAGVGRLMLDARTGPSFSYEMHAVQSYVPRLLQTTGTRVSSITAVERSDILDWGFQAHFLFDRLNIQYISDNLNVKIGRQPVNLTSTFFFTPNDFFAPFSAQTFYRSYKPGVDAARADIQLGEFAQLSLISVLGYQQSNSTGTGWSHHIDAARTSYLARASMMLGDFEWAIIAGHVRKNRVLGGDIQGELFGWLGLRAEGHIGFPKDSKQKTFTEAALSLEHRWENTLSLRVEQFYHGSGVSSTNDYTTKLSILGIQNSYLAKHYTALGSSYEFTALLTGHMTVIHNGLDASNLLAFQALYSVSDEAEIVLQSNLPMGKKTKTSVIRSEFGMLPYSMNIEFRFFF
ncbi:MAG: hypothetical protein R8K22_01840 [Mariprofundaceae bacterium]